MISLNDILVKMVLREIDTWLTLFEFSTLVPKLIKMGKLWRNFLCAFHIKVSIYFVINIEFYLFYWASLF